MTSVVLPHNVEAERMVLAAVLIDNRAFDSAAYLEPDEFYGEANFTMWSVVRTLMAAGTAVDLVTLKSELERRKKLERVGGAAAVAAVIDGVPRMLNAGAWAAIVRQQSQLRKLVALSRKIEQAAMNGEPPDEIVSRADTALLKIGTRHAVGAGVLDNKACADAALDNIGRRMVAPGGLIGYRTGLTALDDIMQGIRPGRLGVVGARPSNGKSMLLTNLAGQIAEQEPNKVVLFFSLEMDGVEIMERRFAEAARVNPNTLHAATQAQRDERWKRLGHVYPALVKSNLRIVEDAWDLTSMEQHARDVRNREGLAAMFIDYVQLMTGQAGKRYENRRLEFCDISLRLRALAKQLAAPVIVAAQLSREAEAKNGKHRPPISSDLAECDNFFRDGHWCVLIDPEPPPRQENRGIAYLYLRKNRGGDKGECKVAYRKEISCFRDLQEEAAAS